MKADAIEALGIDDAGSLWVRPATATLPHIHLEAMQVSWDKERLCLYSPKPREWSYTDWFKQIVSAAQRQGVVLTLETTTAWSNIDDELRRQIVSQPGPA